MTRAQRRAHMIVWIVLGPLLLVLLGWAIASRSEIPATPTIEAAP